ncbi:MAG: hypothetical protein P1P84_19990 [Deferrisomatales bacterium]|nr:hypothetical protein [Deferrisomatales bacterium]
MIHRVREMGQGFRAHCPACGGVTRHRAVGDGLAPDSARCHRCGRAHRAHPLEDQLGGAESSHRPQPPPLHRRRIPDGVEQQWHDQLAEVGPDAAVAYRIDRTLEVGQWLDHPRFGLGVVRKLLPPGTAEVHFQQGFKRLRCRL